MGIGEISNAHEIFGECPLKILPMGIGLGAVSHGTGESVALQQNLVDKKTISSYNATVESKKELKR